MGVYHSFRNHYILNSKTTNLCNCYGKKWLKITEGELLPVTVSLLEEQENCNCNENEIEDPPEAVM